MSIATLHHATYLAEILNHLVIRDNQLTESNTDKPSCYDINSKINHDTHKKKGQ